MNCINCKLKDETILELRMELDRVKNIELESWKGKDQMQFQKLEDYWVIITHQKATKDSEPKESKHKLPKELVQNLWKMIKSLDHQTSFKELGPMIIRYYRLPHKDYKELFGNRRDYFDYFYYSAKVLNHLKYISYKGRTIKVLR